MASHSPNGESPNVSPPTNNLSPATQMSTPSQNISPSPQQSFTTHETAAAPTPYPQPAIESGLEVAYNQTDMEQKQIYTDPTVASHGTTPLGYTPVYQGDAPKYDAGYAGAAAQEAAARSSVDERKICGLKRSTFFIIICVTAVVIVAAIVGGVVGGLKAAGKLDGSSEDDSDSGSGSGSSSGSDNSGSDNSSSSIFPTGWSTNVLPTTNLAAINWTSSSDSDSTLVHRAVFYQNATNNHILASIYDPSAATWSISDVTELAQSADSSIATPKNGTGLATIAKISEVDIRVYYADESNQLVELVTTTSPDSDWSLGSLGQTVIKRLSSTGNIAALWQECDVCYSADPVVVFQNSEGHLEKSNGTTKTIIQEDIDDGSGIGLTQFDVGLPSMRLHYVKDDELTERGWNDANGFGAYIRIINSDVPGGGLPEMTSQAFGDNGWIYMIISSVTAEGSVSMNWWDNSDWSTDSEVRFTDEDGNTVSPTGLFLSQEMKLYGLVDGRIHVWDMGGEDNPYSLTYVEEVSTPDMVSL